MRKTENSSRDPGATIRFSPEKMARAKKIAAANYTSFNGLVEMLIDAAIDYADEEGKLQLPLKLVTERDYQEFQEAWSERAKLLALHDESPKAAPRAAIVKTASRSKTSGKQAS